MMQTSIAGQAGSNRGRLILGTLAAILGLMAAGHITRAQTVYTYYTGSSNAYLNNTHWLVGGSVAADFPGVTASGSAIVNGTITDIADFGTLYSSISTIGINFNTSSNSGNNSNAGAAGSLTVGAFDFTSSLAKNLSVGNSSTTSGATGTLSFTGQTLDGVANTIVSNESAYTATLAPSVATGSTMPAMSIGLNNTTNNVIQATSTGGINISVAIVNGNGTNLTVDSTGSGLTTLSGANTYTGTTTITAGTLLVNGTNSGTGAVAVNGGTLGGSGSIAGNTTVAAGATLAPGATGGSSIAKLTLGNAATSLLTINGNYAVNLTGSATPIAGTSYDQINNSGALTLNATSSTLTVTTASASGLSASQVLYIALNAGTSAVVGNFSGLTEGSTVTDNLGDTFSISYLANGDGGVLGNDISLTVLSVVAVPEPATLLGGALLIGTLGWNQRRRLRGFGAVTRPACAS